MSTLQFLLYILFSITGLYAIVVSITASKSFFNFPSVRFISTTFFNQHTTYTRFFYAFLGLFMLAIVLINLSFLFFNVDVPVLHYFLFPATCISYSTKESPTGFFPVFWFILFILLLTLLFTIFLKKDKVFGFPIIYIIILLAVAIPTLRYTSVLQLKMPKFFMFPVIIGLGAYFIFRLIALRKKSGYTALTTYTAVVVMLINIVAFIFAIVSFSWSLIVSNKRILYFLFMLLFKRHSMYWTASTGRQRK